MREKNKMFKFINHYLGMREWGIITTNPILENIFIFFYIQLAHRSDPIKFIINLGFFIFFSFTMFAVGYLINDLADLECDKGHRDSNVFFNVSVKKSLLVIIIALLVNIICIFWYLPGTPFLITMIIWYIMTISYSVKPFALKNRGLLGLISVTLALRTLPGFLIFFAFNYNLDTPAIIILLYLTVRGISADLSHQTFHFNQDSANNISTFVVTMGYDKSIKLVNMIFSLERFFLLIVFYYIADLIYVSVGSIEVLFSLLILGIVLTLLVFLAEISYKKNPQQKNPHVAEFGKKNIIYFLHKTAPKILFTIILMGAVFLRDHILIYTLIPFFFLWGFKPIYKKTKTLYIKFTN